MAFAVNFLDSFPTMKQLKWVMITMDESYFHVYDPDSKVQNMAWLAQGEQRIQVARQSRLTAKIMMIPFFDCQGLIHVEYMHNQTVTKKNFKPVLEHAWEAVHWRCSLMWRGRDKFRLHMDNAGPHHVDLVLNALRQWGWARLPHPLQTCHLVTSFYFCI